MIDFQTSPDEYRHWSIRVEDRVARLDMNVDPKGGLDGSYELKLNSYDLGVDIELADAIQRIRFEHPEVGAVVIGSAIDRVFCAGANIGMLGGAPHPLKVNFCKFTNETRNSIEDATTNSGQKYVAAINGTAAGGGYELALATDYIMLVDDRSATVALPEVPLLGVLPGTGGLTRLVDKRHVRRDRADVFCTVEEGVKGSRAVEWKLVDELVPLSSFDATVKERAAQFAAGNSRPAHGAGITMTPLTREIAADHSTYSHVHVDVDRTMRTAGIVIQGPSEPAPEDPDEAIHQGAEFWPLAVGRELEDAVLHLRVNELDIGTFIFRTEGDIGLVNEYDAFMRSNQEDWFIREVLLYWQRILKRVDVTSRTLLALIEPESFFTSVFSELALACDRTYMLQGPWSEAQQELARFELTESSLGLFKMPNGLSRLETRFWGDPDGLAGALKTVGKTLDADQAYQAGLVTDILDEIDWDDEMRVVLEERAAFSPDSLTGMEANLRFAGPETMESKIFGRLTAWQNWVFQRPNASGETGALKRYGSGRRPEFDKRRV